MTAFHNLYSGLQHRSRGFTRFLAVLLVGVVACVGPTSVTMRIPETHASRLEPRAVARAPHETPTIASRRFVNGQTVILNMHGLLFHEDPRDVQENLEYASWLNAGAVRVFATDKINHVNLTGGEVAERIVAMAPSLRVNRVKLIVALMDHYREVPGDLDAPIQWRHGFNQLQLPFYASTWRGQYRQFLGEIVWLVKERGALDVIWAWEIGNEIHTPDDPSTILSFIRDVSAEIRVIDPDTPILPGTMGAGSLDRGIPDSQIARDLYCEAPIHAYTVHTFDWWDEGDGGDVPIRWDFDHIARTQCENGRSIPVIVEELGTSRELAGVYTAHEPWKRLEVELRQMELVMSYPNVAALGVWSAESPRVASIRHDLFRGLTSHRNPDGSSGSCCYGPEDGAKAGTRCELELALRALPRRPDPGLAMRMREANLGRQTTPDAAEPLGKQSPEYE